MIYLASQSPRRQQLLKQIGVRFQTVSCDIDERPQAGEPPTDYAIRMALEKSQKGWETLMQQQQPAHPVLAADTAIRLDNDILGKPDSPAQAEAMLARLSGRSHQVMTSVAVRLNEQVATTLAITQVQMAPLSAAQIRAYVATGECADKAGSYAIQGKGAVLVEAINGSYSGVMGLPLHETSTLLSQFGIALWQTFDGS